MSVAVIDRNDVVLRGRMSAPAEIRTLPSGDPLLTFRLVVRVSARISLRYSSTEAIRSS